MEFTGDGGALIGVSEELVRRQKKPVCINLCDEGDVLRAGDNAGDVEFLKGVTDILSPVSGVVEAVNDALLLSPQTLETAPFTWMIALRQARAEQPLLTEEEYLRYVRREEDSHA
ncbi:MAG: hypothetical protein IJT44_11670 [Clostridia bacterium]|nr:hypothetical protein [Clostridia bacterium]